jgi:putative membrane protein
MIDYDPHHWASHLLDVRGSMIREILCRVALCVAWAAAVVTVQILVAKPHGVSLAISESAHTLIGVALGLLLVFRTNSSYDRFWEGRKLWGGIVNESRNLGRLVAVQLSSDPALARRILGWTSLFAHATMHQLRGTRPPSVGWDVLPTNAVRAALESAHPPLEIAKQMTAGLEEARRRGLISDILFTQADTNTQQLVDYLGGCERIDKTPLPFSYVVHLRRALILYCYTLPFALVDRFGWNAITATLAITYVLDGIEEIGVEIEDPFEGSDNDLPLEDFCATVDNNLRQIADGLPK